MLTLAIAPRITLWGIIQAYKIRDFSWDITPKQQLFFRHFIHKRKKDAPQLSVAHLLSVLPLTWYFKPCPEEPKSYRRRNNSKQRSKQQILREVTGEIYARVADQYGNSRHCHTKPSSSDDKRGEQCYCHNRGSVSRHRAIEPRIAIAISKELEALAMHRSAACREIRPQVFEQSLMLKYSRDDVGKAYSNAHSHKERHNTTPRIATPYHIYNKDIQRNPELDARNKNHRLVEWCWAIEVQELEEWPIPSNAIHIHNKIKRQHRQASHHHRPQA